MLTTTPEWATIRAAGYGGALGDLRRWPTAAQVYRASGLAPGDPRICRAQGGR